MKVIEGVYNPLEMPESEFINRFVVRTDILERLMEEIFSSGPADIPHHIIIQGQRGQGKTCLLRMLSIQVKAHSQNWLIPVLFSEESYGVSRLYKLWERTAEILQSEHPAFSGLVNKFEAFSECPNYETDSFEILDESLRETNTCLLLLIDNIGTLFSRFRKAEIQRLREILNTSPRIRIVGASSLMMESHYDHTEPFYQFFHYKSLLGLDSEEMVTLPAGLGTTEQKAEFRKVLETEPGKIEALRRLTSGVPRTAILLYEIFLDDNGDAFGNLKSLLDRVTPLYKHHMDDLPVQQQDIVIALALAWDAVEVKELAARTRLPGKQVSAQLNQLVKSGVVHKVDTSSKNKRYRLEERFFNIWLLMREGRPGDRLRARWLTRFLESWCNPEQLVKRADRHLDILLTENSFKYISQHLCILLCNQIFEEAFQAFDKLMSIPVSEEENDSVTHAFLFLIAAGQTAKALEYFEDTAYTDLHLIDRFKPIYYALLRERGKSRIDDARSMGPELEETVEEIRTEISDLREMYFPAPGKG